MKLPVGTVVKLAIYQIGFEGKMAVRRGIPGLSIEDEMEGRFPFNLYKKVFEAEVPHQVAEDPFFHFNRGTGGFLDRYERQHGQVQMWSLSVGDVVVVGGEVKRCAKFGWDDITDEWNKQKAGV